MEKIEDLEKETAQFAQQFQKQIYPWFLKQDHQQDDLITTSPTFLAKAIFANMREVIGIELATGMPSNANQTAKTYEAYDEIYDRCFHKEKSVKAKTVAVVNGRQFKEKSAWIRFHMLFLIKDIVLLAFVSAIILMMTLCFGSVHVQWNIVASILSDPLLLILNYLPILFILLLLYALSASVVCSAALGSIIAFIGSMVHYFKLMYRDEPFMISDILLVKEAQDMAGKYDISFNYKQWFTIAVFVILILLIKKYYPSIKQFFVVRVALFATVCISFFLLFHLYYINEDIYEKHGDLNLINRWSETQNYQVRGFFYPFLYSYTYAIEKEPENYDPQAAQDILANYVYEDMPEDKKVNIIGIMLESYNDFSRYDSFVFEEDPYTHFHEIQEESLSGYFLSNIFAGGTVSTERSFLNGYKNHPSYKIPTNSFVHYLDEQNYYTEALHPSYGWFYNRRNINEYLGFANFYYVENYFNKIVHDDILFPEIIKAYENNEERNQPYFNFTVTYQNHGPYEPTPQTDTTYIKRNDTISEENYNIVNNYFSGIAETDIQIKKLFDYFREKDEPVVIIMFGDHNPLLGDNNGGFIQNGLNLDLGTEKGFKEYFEIPYVIWANEPAKEAVGKDFIGEADTMSIMYFMPYLFDYMGLKGNPYMQYLNDLYQELPVINNYYYKTGEEFVNQLTPSLQDKLDEFMNVEYYYSHTLTNYK